MTRIKLRYVQRTKDRHGTWRHYFRRPGHPRATLPGLPGSAEFMAAYQAALEGAPPPVGTSRTAPGSMAALAASFYRSAEWDQLGAASQTNRRRIIDRFLAEHGDKPFALLKPKHIRGFLDDKRATPAAANSLLSILRKMLRHAVDHEMLDSDPTRDVRRLRYRTTGFRTWSEEDIAKYEARWPVGTRERLALALLLYTGQRRSDAVRMGRQHITADGRSIRVKQAKGGEELVLPIHPALREALAAVPHGQLTFLQSQQGKASKPFTPNGFYMRFVEWARAAGVGKGLSPHGLRKAAARRLAEARCSPHQIMAVTGHKTLAEVERYTRAVDQERMARSGIARIGRRRNDTD